MLRALEITWAAVLAVVQTLAIMAVWLITADD